MFPKALLFLCALLASFWSAQAADTNRTMFDSFHRIVFLGDSITHAGQFVDDFEAYLLLNDPDRTTEVLNLGLPSETVSGLSEEGHAGGKFPRPDLHERLARVLARTKPDLVIACYGMNDGIYLPLDEGRFAKFREGMKWLHDTVQTSGVKIIHLTPPLYDALPQKEKLSPEAAGYDAVLTRYSEWLLSQRDAARWLVIDVHGRMLEALRKARAQDPSFTFAKDGVHPNAAGHRVISGAIVDGSDFIWSQSPSFPALLKVIRQREQLLGNAWLQECGHLRPGMNGKPLAQAQTEAEALRPKIVEAAKAVIAEAAKRSDP